MEGDLSRGPHLQSTSDVPDIAQFLSINMTTEDSVVIKEDQMGRMKTHSIFTTIEQLARPIDRESAQEEEQQEQQQQQNRDFSNASLAASREDDWRRNTHDTDTTEFHRRKETTVSQRQTVIDLANANITTKNIARMMKISKRTVQRWKKRQKETESLENMRRCGAPRRTTREEDALIIETATRNPLTTAVKVKRNTQVNVGVHTVRKRLHEAGLHRRTPATKSFLKQANREERLGFAQEYLPAEALFWEKGVFCDKKNVCL